MMVNNTKFSKRPSRLVTYQSSSAESHINYVFDLRTTRKLVKDGKVIAEKECTPQYRLVVCETG